jgi:hypothetical protein
MPEFLLPSKKTSLLNCWTPNIISSQGKIMETTTKGRGRLNLVSRNIVGSTRFKWGKKRCSFTRKPFDPHIRLTLWYAYIQSILFLKANAWRFLLKRCAGPQQTSMICFLSENIRPLRQHGTTTYCKRRQPTNGRNGNCRLVICPTDMWFWAFGAAHISTAPLRTGSPLQLRSWAHFQTHPPIWKGSPCKQWSLDWFKGKFTGKPYI